MGLKAVFFDLDDTLYTSFQAGDAYAYEKLEEWAISTFGDKGKGFADAFRVNRKRLARQQPAMPPTHDRVLFAQGALERMGLNAVRYSREAFRVYWNACRSSRPEFHSTSSRPQTGRRSSAWLPRKPALPPSHFVL